MSRGRPARSCASSRWTNNRRRCLKRSRILTAWLVICPPISPGASWRTLGKNLGQRRKWTMTSFSRGDVVVVDLGMAAKVRPCVVVSISKPDSQRNMSVVVPMTTEIRGGQCEIPFPKPVWLRKESVVNVLGIAGVDNAKIERRISAFPAEKMLEIESVLKRLLGFSKKELKPLKTDSRSEQ